MRLRAKANGNIIVVSEEEGEKLLATGIFETEDGAGAAVVTKVSSAETDTPKGRHKRKDLRAEP